MSFRYFNISLNFLFLIISFVYILLGTFYSIDVFKPVVLFLFIFFLVINILLVVRSVVFKKIIINNKIMFVLFLFSFISMVFSCIYNMSIELFLGVLNFLFLFLFFSLHYSKYKIYQIFDISIKSLFILLTFLNFISGFSIPFKGIFSNPNSLGGLYATISLIGSGVFIDKYKDVGKTDYFILIIIIMSLIFSLLSNSRIAFVLSVICFIFAVVIRFGNFIKVVNKNIFFNYKRLLIILSIFFGIFFLVKLNFQYISDIFLSKFFYKLDNDNFSAGRSEVWQSILDNMSIFGHARHSLHLESLGLAAHNTFMSILDQFGYISALFFILGCSVCLMIYAKFSVIRKYGYLPFFIVIGFVSMSISESMINKTIMFCLLMILNLKSYQFLERK